MLAEEVDYVIGVDTHKDAHTAALVNAMGGVVAGVEVAASDSGYRRLLRLALVQAAGRRAWAVEGTGSYGAGLTSFLQRHGERVIEVERPRRPSRKPGKSDQLDALRAAREALAAKKLALPRKRGSREALRILLATREGALRARTQALCQLHALVVGAGNPSQSPPPPLYRRAGAPIFTAAPESWGLPRASDHEPGIALGGAASGDVAGRGGLL